MRFMIISSAFIVVGSAVVKCHTQACTEMQLFSNRGSYFLSAMGVAKKDAVSFLHRRREKRGKMQSKQEPKIGKKRSVKRTWTKL